MEDYAARFADLLEKIATWIRSMTVDRVSKWIRLTGLGILVATFVFTAVIFLIWAAFEALEIPLSTAGAFAVLGGALFVVGGILWLKKSRQR